MVRSWVTENAHMDYGLTTGGICMPKKISPQNQHDELPAAFGRIELQAQPAWIKKLDKAADALGMSRSAYIRMACNRQMAADRKDDAA